MTTKSKEIKVLKIQRKTKLKGGIYSITLNKCQKEYIGETLRSLNKTLYERKTDI